MKYFLVLTLCSIGAFIAVMRMRPEVFSGGFASAGRFTSAKETINIPPRTPPSVPEKKNTAGGPRSARTERIVEPSPLSPRVEPKLDTSQNETPRSPRFAQATVTADVLPVYATNSMHSRVLKLLNKGDLIQTDLAVIDSVGHWSLIRVPGQRVSGYVRTEDIELTRTASRN